MITEDPSAKLPAIESQKSLVVGTGSIYPAVLKAAKPGQVWDGVNLSPLVENIAIPERPRVCGIDDDGRDSHILLCPLQSER